MSGTISMLRSPRALSGVHWTAVPGYGPPPSGSGWRSTSYLSSVSSAAVVLWGGYDPLKANNLLHRKEPIHFIPFIHSFLPSSIHWFIHSSIHPSIPPFLPSFTHSFMCPFLSRPFAHSIHSLVHAEPHDPERTRDELRQRGSEQRGRPRAQRPPSARHDGGTHTDPAVPAPCQPRELPVHRRARQARRAGAARRRVPANLHAGPEHRPGSASSRRGGRGRRRRQPGATSVAHRPGNGPGASGAREGARREGRAAAAAPIGSGSRPSARLRPAA